MTPMMPTTPTTLTTPTAFKSFRCTDNDNSDASSCIPNLITNINNESITNIFCFGAFADKNSGLIYNNCTVEFSFMSLGRKYVFCDVSL